jgi:cell volume regulation protein A
MPPVEQLLAISSALVILSILAIKLSSKLGIPSFVLFLVVGMLAGSDGPGGIYFDYPALVQSLGVIALTFILFSGGLDTEWNTVRPIIWKGLVLSTFGVVITTLLVGLFASWMLGFTLLEGLLVGAIVSSTDAAAVFMVLRSRNVALKRPLTPLLELESGSNDAMGVLLTIGLTRLLTSPSASVVDLAELLIVQIVIGGSAGYLMGAVMRRILNAMKFEQDGIYPVLSIALVLLTYGLTALLGGNGFLAVYLAGLIMRKGDFAHRQSLLRFHDGLAWLMQITMFVTLGLQVFPSRLLPIMGIGLLVALFLMVVARPASVFLSLALSRMSYREQALISWVGLRGAVPIVLATFPLLAGYAKADMIFHLVFFIVLTSVLLQGPSISFVAKALKVDAPPPGKA